jgi:hypothetical protein
MSEADRRLAHRVFEDLTISHLRLVLEQGGYLVEKSELSDMSWLAREEYEVVSLLLARAKSRCEDLSTAEGARFTPPNLTPATDDAAYPTAAEPLQDEAEWGDPTSAPVTTVEVQMDVVTVEQAVEYLTPVDTISETPVLNELFNGVKNSVRATKHDTDLAIDRTKTTTEAPRATDDPQNLHSSRKHAAAIGESRVEDKKMIYGPGGIPKVGSDPGPKPTRVNLQNGRASQDYAAQIDGYDSFFTKSDGGSGLIISKEGHVSGKKLLAGEYVLIVAARRGDKAVELNVRVSIIPDPRDLWTSIPSDQDAPHAKPDEAFCKIEAPTFMVAASKRGRSHAKDGGYRDDHFLIETDAQSGWNIMIVADGAGSAPLSREGSRIACEFAMNDLRSRLRETLGEIENVIACADEDLEVKLRRKFCDILPGAGLEAAQAISRRAEELEKSVGAFATTIVILVSRQIAMRWVTASFSVGDGGAAIWDDQAKSVRVMCRPDSGEYAGQTRFLSESEFAEGANLEGRVFVDVRDRFTAAFAMTDGITDPKFPTEAIFADADAWAEFWREDLSTVDLRPGEAALEQKMSEWIDFWSRGNHDDRTLAILLLEPQADRAVDGSTERGRHQADSIESLPSSKDESGLDVQPEGGAWVR